jgi:hypothetical protein
MWTTAVRPEFSDAATALVGNLSICGKPILNAEDTPRSLYMPDQMKQTFSKYTLAVLRTRDPFNKVLEIGQKSEYPVIAGLPPSPAFFSSLSFHHTDIETSFGNIQNGYFDIRKDFFYHYCS